MFSKIVEILEGQFATWYYHFVRRGERDVPGIYSLCLMSVIQYLNFLSFALLFCIITNQSIAWLNNVIAISVYLVLLFINYIVIYYWRGKEIVLAKYLEEKAKHKKNNGTYLIFTTMFLLTVSIIYFKVS
jgi:hypothetical protein